MATDFNSAEGDSVNFQRARSLAEYDKRCPVTDGKHDWRYASDAPGWKIGDACARCQRCQLKGIRPPNASTGRSDT